MSDENAAMPNELLDTLLSDFLDEADQLITQLNDNLLQLDEWVQSLGDGEDQRCDKELLNEMFRAAHSIKGLSAMLGLSDINTLTHKIENVFDAARGDELRINADVVDLVFMGLDRLTALVELLKQPDAEPVDCQIVLDKIRQLLEAAGAERQQHSQAEAEQALAANNPPAKPARIQLPEDPLRDISDEEDISDKYLSIFIDEAEQTLDNLSSLLMALEEGGQEELHHPLATAHKLKGAAASVGLNRAAKLAHLMEDLLEELVQSDKELPAETADLLLSCTGALQQYVVELRHGPADASRFGTLAQQLVHVKSAGCLAEASSELEGFHAPNNIVSLAGRLEDALAEIRHRLQSLNDQQVADESGLPIEAIAAIRADTNVDLAQVKALAAHFDRLAEKADELQSLSPEEDEQHPNDDLTGDGAAGDDRAGSSYCGRVQFQPGFEGSALKAELIYEKLARLGDVIHCQPAAEELAKLDRVETFEFRLLSGEARETVVAALQLVGVQEVTVRRDEPAKEA